MANVDIIIRAVDKTGQVFTNLQKKTATLEQTGQKLQKIGLAMAGIGAGITAGFGAAIKTFADFEYAMKNVQVVSGVTGEQLERLANFARELGKTTQFSAKQVAEAQYYLASAGMKTEEIMASLNNILNLAAGTQTELAFASETVVATLSQFNLSAEESSRVADVFMTAISNSQATLQKLADSMRYVGPVANSLGLSLEETTSYLMALYNAGYKGEQAGTMLRGILSQLMDVSGEAAKALQNLGLSVEDVNPEIHSLSEIIDKLAQSGATTTDIITIFGSEAGPGMAALLSQGTSELQKYKQLLEGAGGASEKAAKEQMNSLHGMLQQLKSAFQELQIALGEAVLPSVLAFVKGLTNLINKFNALPESLRNAIANFGLWGGALLTVGGTLTMIIGTILRLKATIGELSIFSQQKFLGITKAVKFLAANPYWAAIVAAIVGIIAAIKLLHDHWDKVVAFFKATTEVIKKIFEGLFKFFKAGWDFVVYLIKSYLDFIYNNFQKVLGGIKALWEGLVNRIKVLWEGFIDFWKNLFETLKKIFFGWVNAIKTAMEKVLGFFKWIGGGIKDIWNGVVDGAKKMSDILVGHSIIPDMVTDINKEFYKMEDVGTKVSNNIARSFGKNLKGIGLNTKTLTSSKIKPSSANVRNNINIQVKQPAELREVLKALQGAM